MNELYVGIFGGTTEGRLFAKKLSEIGFKADLFVATEYGSQFVKDIENINVYQKKLDKQDMIKLFTNKKYDYVVDATHPFAEKVTNNIIEATNKTGLNYLRIIRKTDKWDNCVYFDTFEECVKYLKNARGNILLTTGSKNLEIFTKLDNYSERVYVRILPMVSSLKKCIDLGYLSKNVICMQGPFSEELNIVMIKNFNIKYLVTKETSTSGGFEEKVRACDNTGAKCLVIKKPQENGMVLEEICNYFKKIR